MPNEYMSYMEEQQDLNYREAEQHQWQKLAEHEADQQTEGDLEQRQAEQEQAARLSDPKRTVQDWYNDRMKEAAEQDPTPYQEEVENMFGEEWDRQHKQYNLHQLRYMLKSSLQREQGAYIMQRVAEAEIERLRAELAAYETKFAAPAGKEAELARALVRHFEVGKALTPQMKATAAGVVLAMVMESLDIKI